MSGKYLTSLSKNKIPTQHWFQLAIIVCWMDEYGTTNFVSEYQQHPFGAHTHTHTHTLSLSLHHHDARSYHKGTACGLLMAGLFPRFLSASVQSLFHLEPGCEGLKNLGNGQHDDQHARPYYTVVDWV